MQNKARLELADYEAVSERGLVRVSTPLCAVPVLALLSGFTDINKDNICSFVKFLSPNTMLAIVHFFVCLFNM